MKKRMLLVGMSMMLCLLCGCLETTPLTDAEMDTVAEYAATLLLKYDKNYNTPLYYTAEREVRLTPTPVPTATPTPGAVPEENNTGASGTGSVQDPAAEATPTPTPAAMYDDAETSRQLTEIIAVEDITVVCEGMEVVSSVVSNNYFSLNAKEGRKYAVVSFTLYNNTGADLTFDASDNGLEYSIDINTGTVSRVSLSMLENDLQYMPIQVPANGTAAAVLVFEIADEEINTAHLIIQNTADEVVFIKMK